MYTYIRSNSTWLVTSRLDAFDVLRALSCAYSNMADDEQAIVLAYTSLVVFMLLHRLILFVPSNEINEINVYSNKLLSNLHVITLYK